MEISYDGGTPESSKSTIFVVKAMVTWGFPILKKPPFMVPLVGD